LGFFDRYEEVESSDPLFTREDVEAGMAAV
jgi:hypothetical protein